MSRAFDFVVVGILNIISVAVHLMGTELFAPGQPLHELASGGTALNGASRADLWFEILSIWMPLAAFLGIWAWALIREYKRQVSSSVQRV